MDVNARIAQRIKQNDLRLKILEGKPGTGKTTRLKDMIVGILRDSNYTRVDHIMVISYSRTASRAIYEKLEPSLTANEFWRKYPFFRTIHALCARLLEVSGHNVVDGDFYKRFCRMYGIPYSPIRVRSLDEIDLYGYTGEKQELIAGNVMFNWWQFLKRKCVYRDKVKQAVRERDGLSHKEQDVLSEYPAYLILELYDEWEEMKRAYGKFEYDDMIWDITLESIGSPSTVQYVFVDESHDLSPLQFHLIKQWMTNDNIKEVYFAYDPLQTIYEWNGADSRLVGSLRSLSVEDEVLPKSYRVPRIPWNFACRVAGLLNDVNINKVESADYDGELRFINQEDIPNILADNRSAFVLFRTNKEVYSFLNQMFKHKLFLNGLGRVQTAFSSKTFNNRYNALVKAARGENLTYEELREIISKIPSGYFKRHIKTEFTDKTKVHNHGSSYTPSEVYGLFKDCESLEGLKRIILDSQVNIPQKQKEILIAVDAEYPLLSELSQYVGTYHSSKGLEAQNVILHDFMLHPEGIYKEELKLIFVGLTRTMDSVYIVPCTGGTGIIESLYGSI